MGRGGRVLAHRRREAVEALRYAAYSVNTPVWVERVLLALADVIRGDPS